MRRAAIRGSEVLLFDRWERQGWLLAGVCVLGLLAIWTVGLWAHGDGSDPTVQRAAPELLRSDATRPLASRTIAFEPNGNDYVARDAGTGTLIRTLGFDRDGFVVSVVRGLDRARKAAGLPVGKPYQLIRWNNGQLFIEDLSTGAQIELSAFGQTNRQAIASLLGQPPSQ